MGQEECNNNQDVKSDIILEKNKAVSEEKYDKHNDIITKMEVMQRKIDALKDKIQHEECNLDSEENSIKSNSFNETLSDSFQHSDSSENNNNSEKSQYFSASNTSLCSTSSCSTEVAYLNFNKFVKNFLKDHNPKERLSLLQVHSNKQISFNMMKHSLSDLSSQCSKELELIEKSLWHLDRLAAEFNVTIGNCNKNNNCDIKFMGYKDLGDVGYRNYKRRNIKSFTVPQIEASKHLIDGHISINSKQDVVNSTPLV